jgi:DNA repair ATPase RecN
MLTKAQIRGILKFKSLDVEFDKVTTIIGPTDKGKSAFIWALWWVMTNPVVNLDEFVHNKSTLAQMRLFLDGQSVLRKKGKRKNTYNLNKEKTYRSFKKEKVPAKIKSLFNIGDVNFQFQHDNPFWLSRTPGMLSRELNKLINLEVMDNTLSNLDSWLRTARDRKADTEKDIQDLSEQLEFGQFIHEFDAKLSTVEKLESRFLETASERRIIHKTIKKAVSCRGLSFRACTGREMANLAVLRGNIYAGLRDSKKNLGKLIKRAKSTQAIISNKPPDISILEADFNALDIIRDKKSKLAKLIESHKAQSHMIKKYRHKADRAEKKLKKDIGKICPLCGKG